MVGNFTLQNHQLKQVLKQKLFPLAMKSEQVVEEGSVNHLPGAGAWGKDSLVCRPRIACSWAALPLPLVAHEEQEQDYHPPCSTCPGSSPG